MKKFLPLLLKVIIAGTILGFLFAGSGKAVFSRLGNMDPFWLTAALALYLLHIFANAWRWHLLLKAAGIRCTLWEAFSLTMQSFFFSLVIPGGAIGGDLVRLTFLTRRVPKDQKFDGGISILIDRFTGMIGIFALALMILPFSLPYLDGGSKVMSYLILLLVLGSCAGLAGAVFVIWHKSFARLSLCRKMEDLFNRFSRGFYGKVVQAIDCYSSRKKELVICILASILFVNGVLGAEAFCIARGLVPGFRDFTASLASITIGNIAGLLPLTPSGFGARDFFVLPILENGGMSHDNALAVTLCISGVILLFNAAGGLFFLCSRGTSGKPDADAGEK